MYDSPSLPIFLLFVLGILRKGMHVFRSHHPTLLFGDWITYVTSFEFPGTKYMDQKERKDREREKKTKEGRLCAKGMMR